MKLFGTMDSASQLLLSDTTGPACTPQSNQAAVYEWCGIKAAHLLARCPIQRTYSIYVDNVGGSDAQGTGAGKGTLAAPYATIAKANLQAAYYGADCAIFLKYGQVYNEACGISLLPDCSAGAYGDASQARPMINGFNYGIPIGATWTQVSGTHYSIPILSIANLPLYVSGNGSISDGGSYQLGSPNGVYLPIAAVNGYPAWKHATLNCYICAESTSGTANYLLGGPTPSTFSSGFYSDLGSSVTDPERIIRPAASYWGVANNATGTTVSVGPIPGWVRQTSDRLNPYTYAISSANVTATARSWWYDPTAVAIHVNCSVNPNTLAWEFTDRYEAGNTQGLTLLHDGNRVDNIRVDGFGVNDTKGAGATDDGATYGIYSWPDAGDVATAITNCEAYYCGWHCINVEATGTNGAGAGNAGTYVYNCKTGFCTDAFTVTKGLSNYVFYTSIGGRGAYFNACDCTYGPLPYVGQSSYNSTSFIAHQDLTASDGVNPDSVPGAHTCTYCILQGMTVSSANVSVQWSSAYSGYTNAAGIGNVPSTWRWYVADCAGMEGGGVSTSDAGNKMWNMVQGK